MCDSLSLAQLEENRKLLQALRQLLEEFREELQEEEKQRCQLQQSYANDKAAWEVKWAEMKCQVVQVQMASQRRLSLKGRDPIWCRELTRLSARGRQTCCFLYRETPAAIFSLLGLFSV